VVLVAAGGTCAGEASSLFQEVVYEPKERATSMKGRQYSIHRVGFIATAEDEKETDRYETRAPRGNHE
jgi:hypothetical protein